MKPFRTILLLVCCVVPDLALAQSPQGPPPAATAPTSVRQAEAGARDIRDLTVSSVIQIPGNSVQLIAAKEEKAVVGGVAYTRGSFALDAKLKGPLAEGSPETTLLTLESLSNAASLDLGLGWLKWTPSADTDAQFPACLELERIKAKDLPAAKERMAAINKGAPLVCTRGDFPKLSYRERFLAATDDQQRTHVCTEYARSQLRDFADIDCRASTLPTTSLWQRYDEAIDWDSPWQLGLRGKVGYRDLNWANTGTGKPESNSVIPWEVSVGANIDVANKIILGAEYRILKDVAEQKKRTICEPLEGAATNSSCREMPFGRYKDKERQLVTVFARKWASDLAIDLRLSYDLKNNFGGIEVPVSFIAAEKGLTVGVAAGWTSKSEAPQRGWTVRAFVGDLLKLWPGR